jgi:dTDP-4-dehydrorhamnose 3,5-epimerase
MAMVTVTAMVMAMVIMTIRKGLVLKEFSHGYSEENKVEVTKLSIPGLVTILPRIFGDDRGAFFETFNKQSFTSLVADVDFVQDNQSTSKANVLRGLHFQAPPYAQGKLVRVISGSVVDVAVDIRKGSPTYGKHEKVLLTGENNLMFYIPPGFAHGFVALEDNTIFHYKCTGFYNKASEGCLLWNDPTLNIDWGTTNPLISPKDQEGEKIEGFSSPFTH